MARALHTDGLAFLSACASPGPSGAESHCPPPRRLATLFAPWMLAPFAKPPETAPFPHRPTAFAPFRD